MMILGRARRFFYQVADIISERPTLKPGAIVWCDLGLGSAEHSGVYIGDNKIIELNGDGYLKILSIYDFIKYSDFRTGMSLYSICDISGQVLADYQIASRAIRYLKENERRGYNLLFDNCHQFTAGCILNDLVNPFNTFEGLQVLVRIHFHELFISSRVVY